MCLIHSYLGNLRNIQDKINSVAGLAVMVEFKMRLIGELCGPIRDKLVVIVKESKRKRDSSKYWDCSLCHLDKAIDEVFHDKLTFDERQKVKNFRDLRNKLLHGDFVGLMKEMKIVPTGREILPGGTRNNLDSPNVKESIFSVVHNQAFEEFRIMASEVIEILDKLIIDSDSKKL